jgi:hypothetical protein
MNETENLTLKDLERVVTKLNAICNAKVIAICDNGKFRLMCENDKLGSRDLEV